MGLELYFLDGRFFYRSDDALICLKGKAATVTEAESMTAGKAAGLVDVKVVKFSETHTAEKMVIRVARR